MSAHLPGSELPFLEELLAHAGVLVQSVGADGRVRYVNDAWLRTLGYERAETIGLDIFEVIHPDSLDHCRAVFARVLAGEDVRRLEAVFRRKDGSGVEVEGSTSVHFEGDRPIWTRGVFVDVTARKQEARAAAEARRELELFCATMTHDLRAPLRAVGGFVSVVTEQCGVALNPGCRESLARVQVGLVRMGALLEDLLSHSRTGGVELRPERVDLSAIARRIVRDLRRADPGRVVDVTIADGLIARMDAQMAALLLENLIGNAWKYTSRLTHAHIEVGAEREEGATRYFVRDDGPGFDPVYSVRLFQPFVRLHGNAEFEGTGLGLATVFRIVRRHGGTVAAESQPGVVTTFSFTLPVAALVA
ncbi:MAG: PAS domain S-box protein [Pseudomonadota bacterium]|nr:PAS domain S-box protein [Pseudomonadota bacterium]